MKHTFIFILFFVTFLHINAQRRPSADSAKLAKFEQIRNELLKNKLELNDSVAALFFPIYNEYKKKELELTRKINQKTKAANVPGINEQSAKNLLDEIQQLQMQKAQLFGTYSQKFIPIISAAKTARLLIAEREVHREIQQRIKQNRQKPPPPPR